MNTNFKNIGELLCLRRKSKGLTQDEVGAMIGVQKAMVSKVENGSCVNFNTISRIADALEVEPVVELKPMKKADKNVIDYIMTAIIEFSKRHRLTIREASNYLNRFKGIAFLTEFYDVEHTLSFNDCEEGLTVVCQKNGGAIICYPHSSGGSDQYAEEIMKDRNASYLFEGISADVVRYLVEREGMELTDAISTFHNSETFSKLEDFSTGLYIESPAYVYDLLLSELRNGRLVP